MAPKKKISSYSPNEILAAQREYARRVHKSVGGSDLRTYKNLVFANPPQVAADFIASTTTNSFAELQFLFLFSINSDEDKLIFQLYSDAYKSVHNQLGRIEEACKRTKVNFLDICNLTMDRTPPYIFEGKKTGVLYTFESDLSELAISLRSDYTKEMPDKNHINIIEEHFSQFGIRF